MFALHPYKGLLLRNDGQSAGRPNEIVISGAPAVGVFRR